MGLRDVGYQGLVQGARGLLHLAAPFNEKLKRGLAGHATGLARLHEWATRERRRNRPLVWVHAPSVGEALMAQAIVRELRARRPELQLVFTHFSPSAERMRDQVGADIAAYLPWDTTGAMNEALDLLAPAAIVFVRTEIWPTLVRLARQRALPVLLVNAVLAPHSSRLKPLARFALGPAYGRLQAAGVINGDVARRISRLGVPQERIRITGDARFDQVCQRVAALDPSSPLLRRLANHSLPTIVAGSTWPSDEERLFPALAAGQARWVIAPHDPTDAHLGTLERVLTEHGLAHARLTRVADSTESLPRVILVDRMGILADLYSIATVAYVGGAFHDAGVHSVLEPAALGVPVVFGPDHTNAAEAQELVDAGGGFSVSDGATLKQTLVRLTTDRSARERAGNAAHAFVIGRRGGASANATLILDQLS